MSQSQIIIDEEQLKCKYGILWIIICENQELEQYKEQLSELYETLQIKLTQPVFQNIRDTFYLIERIGPQKIGFIKYAIIKNIHVLGSSIQINQSSILSKRSKTYYYEVSEFSNIKDKIFKEMNTFLNKLAFNQIFTEIKKSNWVNEQFIMLLMKHTMINDPNCSEVNTHNALEKTFSNIQNLSEITDQTKREIQICLYGYQKLPFKERMNIFDFGFVYRTIFESLKDKYFNSNVSCYKILRTFEDVQMQPKSKFYFQNTFQPFYELPSQNINYASIIKQVNSCLQDNNRKIIFVKIQAHHESGNRFINFGYKREKKGTVNQIIFNCFTLFELTRWESKQYYRIKSQYYQNSAGASMPHVPARDKFNLIIYEFKTVSEKQLLKLQGYGQMVEQQREQLDCLIYYFNYMNRYRCDIKIQNLQAELSGLSCTHQTISQIMKRKEERMQSQFSSSMMKLAKSNSMLSTKASSILKGKFDISLISDSSMTADQLSRCPSWNRPIEDMANVDLTKIGILLHRVKLFLLSCRHRKTKPQQNQYIVKQLGGIFIRLRDIAQKLCPGRDLDQQDRQYGKYNICRLFSSCCSKEAKRLTQNELTEKIEDKLRLELFPSDSQSLGLQKVRKSRRDILRLFQLLKSILLELHSECVFSIQSQDFYKQCFTESSTINSYIENLKLDIISLKQKEKNYNSLLKNYSEQLQKYTFPIAEKSLKRNLKQQRCILVSWQKLEKSYKGNKILRQKIQQLIILFKKSNYNQSKLTQTFKSYASCLRLQIGFLKLKGYCDDSIEIIQLYRLLASIYFSMVYCSDHKIDKDNQLISFSKQIDSIQFKQTKNEFITKAFVYKKVAEIMLRIQRYQQCQSHIEISLKLLRKAERQIIQTGYPFLFYRQIAELEMLSAKIFKQNQQQSLKNSLKFIVKKKEEWGAASMGFLIDAQMLSLHIDERMSEIKMLRRDELNGRQSNQKHSLRYKDILQNGQYSIYLKGYRCVLACVDLFLCFYNCQFLPPVKQRKKRRAILEEMQRNIKVNSQYLAKMQDNLKLINKQSQQYELSKWVPHLQLFLKQRSEAKRLFQLFPADEAIENCLQQFLLLKRSNRMTTQLKRFYLKIYAVYKHYTSSYYQYYKPQPNMYNQLYQQSHNLLATSLEVEEEPDLRTKICWLFLLETSSLTNPKEINLIKDIQKQQEKGFFGKKIKNPISSSFQQFRQNIRILKKYEGVRIRINLVLELKFWRKNQRSQKNLFQNVDYKQLDCLIIFDFQEKAISMVSKQVKVVNSKVHSEESEGVMGHEGENYAFMPEKPIGASSSISQKDIEITSFDPFDRPLGSKITHIKAKQISNLLNQILASIKPVQMILNSTIFYTQSNRRRISTYHNKLQYFRSIRDDFERDNFSQQAVNKQLIASLQLANISVHGRLQLIIKIWNQLDSLYRNMQHADLDEEESKSFNSLLYATIKIYIDSAIQYHEWVNTTLRLDYQLSDTELKCSNRPLIFPIYHSIRQIYKLQDKDRLSKQIKLYRWAYMSRQQFQNYKNYFSGCNYYIKMANIFSTSLSQQYILRNILNKQKHHQDEQKYSLVVYQIQVNLSQDDLDHQLNHGFIFPISLVEFNQKIKYQHDIKLAANNQYESEQQVVFNTGSIFKILKVNEKVKCQAFINQRSSFKKASRQLDIDQKSLEEQIIVITLEFGNFNSILTSQNTSKQAYYFQTSFAEQRKKTKIKNNSKEIGVCFYDIVSYYLDEGLPAVAKKIIQQRFQAQPLSVTHFLSKNRGYNHIHRLIKIHQRLGQDQHSSEYIEGFVKQLATLLAKTKQNLTVSYTQQNQLQVRRFLKISLDFRKELIKLYYDKKDLTKFEQSKDAIDRQLAQLKALSKRGGQSQNFKNNSYEIFLHMINSQFHLQQYQIEQSMKQFEITLGLMEQTASTIYQSRAISTDQKDALYTDFKQNVSELKQIINDYHARGVKSVERVSQFIQKMPSLLRTIYSIKGDQFNSQQINNIRNSQVINNLSNISISSHSEAANLFDLSQRTNDSFDKARADAHPIQMQQIAEANFDLYCKVNLRRKQLQSSEASIHNEMQGLKHKILSRVVQDLDQLGYKEKSIELSKKKIEYLKQERKMQLSTQKQFQRSIQMIFKSNSDSCIKLQECRYYQYRAHNLFFAFLKRYELSKPQERQSRLRQYIPKIQDCLRQAQSCLIHAMTSGGNRELSNENLQIRLLQLRIQCVKSSDETQSIRRKMDRLGNLLYKKDKEFDVRNEYIIFYQINTRFRIKIKKQINISYYDQFKERLRKRYALKPNSIENAIDCIKLYQELTLDFANLHIENLEEDLNTFYMYIEEANELCYNHSLYWKFVQSKYQRIRQRQFKTTKEFLMVKLDFLLRAMRIIRQQKDEDQLVLQKFQIMIQGFIDNRHLQKIEDQDLKRKLQQKNDLFKLIQDDRAKLIIKDQQLISRHESIQMEESVIGLKSYNNISIDEFINKR